MQFHEINAFTKDGVNVLGNPATVIIVDEFPSEEEMGAAAKTLASPMTTFLKPGDEPNVYDVRHFSPDGDECHICGHATMAAMEYLASQKPELRNQSNVTVRMNPKFGVSANSAIEVAINGKEISLTMPAIMDLQPITDQKFYDILCEGLNINEDDLIKPCHFAPRIRDLVIAFKDPSVLLTLEPNFAKLKDMALHGDYQHEGLMGTAPSNIQGFDVINRVFLPGIDVNEDIACGSGNCSVIPYWASLNKDQFAGDKDEFKVIYPYPPGQAGYVGGVQHIKVDRNAATIVLTGEAEYKRSIDIKKEKKPDNKNGFRL